MICHLCGDGVHDAFSASEMMLGLRTEHQYEECRSCGSLQIATVPADLHRFYDRGAYYSLQGQEERDSRGTLRAWLGNRLDRAQIFSEGGLFGVLARRRANPVADRLRSYLAESPVKSFDARILDVGCGSGALVRELAMHGFRRVEGIDPYMADGSSSSKPRLRRANVADLRGEHFDLVMLTHVLEHVEQPLQTLQAIRAVLAPGGVCRIEVPVTDSEARRVYGKHWVELDPPRHLHVPSRNAVRALAEKAGLTVFRSEPAGTGFEFWGSEMYSRGLTLYDRDRGGYREASDVFTPSQLNVFEARALAAAGRGESGRERFYLRLSQPVPAL